MYWPKNPYILAYTNGVCIYSEYLYDQYKHYTFHLFTHPRNWNDHVEKMINTKKILEKWTKFIEWQSKINGQYNKLLVFLLMS